MSWRQGTHSKEQAAPRIHRAAPEVAHGGSTEGTCCRNITVENKQKPSPVLQYRITTQRCRHGEDQNPKVIPNRAGQRGSIVPIALPESTVRASWPCAHTPPCAPLVSSSGYTQSCHSSSALPHPICLPSVQFRQATCPRSYFCPNRGIRPYA